MQPLILHRIDINFHWIGCLQSLVSRMKYAWDDNQRFNLDIWLKDLFEDNPVFHDHEIITSLTNSFCLDHDSIVELSFKLGGFRHEIDVRIDLDKPWRTCCTVNGKPTNIFEVKYIDCTEKML